MCLQLFSFNVTPRDQFKTRRCCGMLSLTDASCVESQSPNQASSSRLCSWSLFSPLAENLTYAICLKMSEVFHFVRDEDVLILKTPATLSLICEDLANDVTCFCPIKIIRL